MRKIQETRQGGAVVVACLTKESLSLLRPLRCNARSFGGLPVPARQAQNCLYRFSVCLLLCPCRACATSFPASKKACGSLKLLHQISGCVDVDVDLDVDVDVWGQDRPRPSRLPRRFSVTFVFFVFLIECEFDFTHSCALRIASLCGGYVSCRACLLVCLLARRAAVV